MFGIILFIIGVVVITTGVIGCRKWGWDNLTVLFSVIGTLTLAIGMCLVVSFLVSKVSYNKDILLYEQKYELTSNKLSSFSDNANFINSFSDAYDEAINYNVSVYNRQLSYKYCGLLFSYNDYRILDLKQIDLSKYKIKDSCTSIKLKIDK